MAVAGTEGYFLLVSRLNAEIVIYILKIKGSIITYAQ